MISTSALFKQAIRSSHQIATRCILLTTPGTEGLDPAGTDQLIVDGTVTLDSTADIRGTLDLILVGTWPIGSGVNQILPYGSELAVSRGITYGNGNIERVQLGIFRIDTVEESARGQLRVTGYDRMKLISDSRLLVPVTFDSTFTFGTAVAALIHATLPGATITWDDTTTRDTALPRQIAEPTDRLGVLNQIVTAAGKVCYFDNQGKFVVKTPPSATSASVATVNAGRGGILISTDRRVSRDAVYNAVIATGDAIDSNPPVTGYAFDNNPLSPTYWYGPFGQVPEYFSSPLLITVAQCQTAAQGLLAQTLGLPFSVDFTAVPDPSYEPLDTVTVVYPPDLAVNTDGVTETHVISALNVGLSPSSGPLTAHTRLQTAFNFRVGTPSMGGLT